MRGLKDHCKLTMVGFRFDRSQCSFGGYGIRSGSSREDCESRTRKVGVLASLWRRFTGPAGHCRGRTKIQTSLGSFLETGRWQALRGECRHKGTKVRVPRSKGEHSLSGISGTRGVLEQQRGLRTVEESPEKRVVVA